MGKMNFTNTKTRVLRCLSITLIAVLIMAMFSDIGINHTGAMSGNTDGIRANTALTGVQHTEFIEVGSDSMPNGLIEEYEQARCIKRSETKTSGGTDSYSYDFYYEQLSPEQKDIFNQLSAEISNEHPYTYLETTLDLNDVFPAVDSWIWSSASLYAYRLCATVYYTTYDDDGVYMLEFEVQECDEEAFNKLLDECISCALSYNDLFDREYAVHSFIAQNISYDFDDFINRHGAENQSAGSLYDCSGVCAAIARFMALVNLELGIPCSVIVTDEHAFNYIYVDGEWFLSDATWDLGNEEFLWFMIGSDSLNSIDCTDCHTSFTSYCNPPALSESDYMPSRRTESQEPVFDNSDGNTDNSFTDDRVENTGILTNDDYSDIIITGYDYGDNYTYDYLLDEYDVNSWDYEPLPDCLTPVPEPYYSDYSSFVTPEPYYDFEYDYSVLQTEEESCSGYAYEITPTPIEDPSYAVSIEIMDEAYLSGRTPEYRYEYKFGPEGAILETLIIYADGTEQQIVYSGEDQSHYEYIFNKGGAIVMIQQTGEYGQSEETFAYNENGNIIRHQKFINGLVLTEERIYNKKNEQKKLIVTDSDGFQKTYKFKSKRRIYKEAYVCGTIIGIPDGTACFYVCVATYKNGKLRENRFYIHGSKE